MMKPLRLADVTWSLDLAPRSLAEDGLEALCAAAEASDRVLEGGQACRHIPRVTVPNLAFLRLAAEILDVCQTEMV